MYIYIYISIYIYTGIYLSWVGLHSAYRTDEFNCNSKFYISSFICSRYILAVFFFLAKFDKLLRRICRRKAAFPGRCHVSLPAPRSLPRRSRWAWSQTLIITTWTASNLRTRTTDSSSRWKLSSPTRTDRGGTQNQWHLEPSGASAVVPLTFGGLVYQLSKIYQPWTLSWLRDT